MIGLQSSLSGQIFVKYAGNLAFVQFRCFRGNNRRFGRLYKSNFERLAGLVFYLWNKERKDIFLLPVVDVLHFFKCIPAKRNYSLQTVNKSSCFALRYVP